MGIACVHTRTLTRGPYPAQTLSVPLWHRLKASRDGDRGMLLPLSSLIPRAERWSPVLDRLCRGVIPASNTPSGQLLPTPPLEDPACSADSKDPRGWCPAARHQCQPATLLAGFSTTWRKGHRCRRCSHGGCAGRSCKHPAATVQAESTAVTRPQEQTPPTALGSACSNRTPAASPDLVLRTKSLQDQSTCGRISLSWVGISTASPLPLH